MATIKWRPEVNVLTTPPSYRIQAMPSGSVGYTEMGADISRANPIYTEEMISSLGPLIMDWIQQQLINGKQVTFPKAFTFSVSFTGRLDSPDDPLPDNNEILQINVRAAQPYINTVRYKAKLEREGVKEKKPVLNSSEDTKLKLADVLYAAGVLKLTGNNLNFAESNPQCGCIIKGTASGAIRQSTYASVANSMVLLVPDIPEQDQPWQNEYTVTLTTQYSKHGTLRSGTSRRKLRSPLTVTDLNEPSAETGILSGGAATEPYVSISGGTVTASEMLRVQAIIDARSGVLLMNVLDMQEGARAGAWVTVTANGQYLLQGFSDSAVTSLTIRVNDYAALLALTKNSYAGRLVDILEIRMS